MRFAILFAMVLCSSYFFANYLQKNFIAPQKSSKSYRHYDSLLESQSTAKSNVLWNTNFQKSFKKAKKNGQPLMIYFWADWCLPCKQVEKEVFSQERFFSFVRRNRFVLLRVDLSEDKKQSFLVNKYNVQEIPGFVIINPLSKKYKVISGYKSKTTFWKKLKKGLIISDKRIIQLSKRKMQFYYLSLLKKHPQSLLYSMSHSFSSCLGQTFFISLFMPHMQQTINLSSHQFGVLYAIATFLSAFLLSIAGRWIDYIKLNYYSLISLTILFASMFLTRL